MQCFEAPLNNEVNVCFCFMFYEFRTFHALSESNASTSSVFGLPINSKISSIWPIVDFPGNIAFPTIYSPNTQPTDQTSTAFEYLFDPRTISGALYHLVATYSVIFGSPSGPSLAIDLANPKSANLIKQFESINTFDGFKSL